MSDSGSQLINDFMASPYNYYEVTDFVHLFNSREYWIKLGFVCFQIYNCRPQVII